MFGLLVEEYALKYIELLSGLPGIVFEARVSGCVPP